MLKCSTTVEVYMSHKDSKWFDYCKLHSNINSKIANISQSTGNTVQVRLSKGAFDLLQVKLFICRRTIFSFKSDIVSFLVN